MTRISAAVAENRNNATVFFCGERHAGLDTPLKTHRNVGMAQLEKRRLTLAEHKNLLVYFKFRNR
jgi:hypothetical protein